MNTTPALTGEVLVIGAGPAGLAAAFCLEKAGIPYTVVERADIPASTWANLYGSLRLNTAGFVTHLPGRRLPWRYGLYPKGSDLYAYLREYAAQKRGQRPRQEPFNICYGVEVMRVALCERGGVPGWWAETSVGNAWFPFVIIASGRFSKPYIPPILGLGETNIQVLHARDYHSPDEFAGQRVLVAGGGASGGDIALELARTAQHPVLFSVRSDIVIARRYPYGLPDPVWVLLTRLFIPTHWRRAFLDKIIYAGFPEAKALERTYGLRFAPNRTNRRGTGTPVRGRALIDAMVAGTIQPVRGIRAFEPDAVVLDDGSRHRVDTAILSTGYRPAIDYLDMTYERDRDGWPRRISDLVEGGSTEVRGAIGLHLVGRFYRGLGPLYNIRLEAIRAVAEIAARRRARG